MPIIKRFDDKFEFEVNTAETDDEYAQDTYVFLSHNLMVVENWESNDEYAEGIAHVRTNYHPIIEHPTMGLCMWDNDDSCWVPVDDITQKAYSDYVAEKELLRNPVPKKVKAK